MHNSNSSYSTTAWSNKQVSHPRVKKRYNDFDEEKIPSYPKQIKPEYTRSRARDAGILEENGFKSKFATPANKMRSTYNDNQASSADQNFDHLNFKPPRGEQQSYQNYDGDEN